MEDPKHIVSAAAVVLNEEGHLLLIKGPKRGWEMPGGQVEEGESAMDAAVRETKEESGIDIEIIKFCGVFQNKGDKICNLLFLAKPLGGELTVTAESLETGFYPVQEALEQVTWTNFKERIMLCLNEDQHPFFIDF
ncbi:NUDIX hydrolase [Salipaludibacillus aurantiacus]|uniref:ADP-ribose pyrophosphatase YjhB, NUDIX family n=1 Tax=Salipaludibacillus aurantiacus TaxID=1601833 RepID=A0A1H9WCD9_9BACI|nr:NUDIX domain-containing protein [Salipaludibacillus aurantiacus]SES31616.1 ADP-ribose pyrophosphatase YjhB, NUDIX family [Salipaludibacillus aurantiacus]